MDVTFLDEKRFVWAQFHGPWEMEDFAGIIEKVLMECRARKLELLLADFTRLEAESLSFLDRYRMGSEAVALLPDVTRLAAVVPSGLIDSQKFGERVAQNRGLNVRVFAEIEEARRWLLDDKPK